MSGISGFEYAVSTETSKDPIPNHTLRRDSYADAMDDLAHDSRSILPSTLTLSNLRSPRYLILAAEPHESFALARRRQILRESWKEEDRDRVHVGRDIARTARKMVLRLTISVVFQVRL
jgi:hypothetical protein